MLDAAVVAFIGWCFEGQPSVFWPWGGLQSIIFLLPVRPMCHGLHTGPMVTDMSVL